MAKKILYLRKRGNQLLTSILLGVTLANSIFSILMAEIEGNTSGFLISTSVIVVFGEIVPQATGNRFGLQISYALRFFVYIVFYATFIITYPIGAILDKILGEEAGQVLTKHQMKRLFEQYEKS